MKGIFITGTDTEVGKTYVGTLIAKTLAQKGINVAPRKPVESGCLKQDDGLVPEDAEALMEASKYQGNLEDVCPYRFEPAISPQRAAKLAGISLSINDLVTATKKQLDEKQDFVLVEGAGGFYSPLCKDGLNADLAEQLSLPVILVAENKLGCINQVLLTVEAIKTRKLKLLAIILNTRADIAPGMNNREDLSQLLDYPVFSLPRNDINLPTELIDRITLQ